jgi:hypothetical protein
MFVEGRFGPKTHPAIGVARGRTTLLARIFRHLDVAIDGGDPRLGIGAKPGPKRTDLRSVS